MRLPLSSLPPLILLVSCVGGAFVLRPSPPPATAPTQRCSFVGRSRLKLADTAASSSDAAAAAATSEVAPPMQKTAGLITFDLDDTLYPIAPVIDEANAAFSRAMERFGYEGIEPSDIVRVGKEIREKMDPEEAAVLTHTEVRKLAIRRVMEDFTLKKKLEGMAEDWATPVSHLAGVVVQHAKKWATQAVSPSIVDAVLTAWEMERHHAAERHLYPEVVDALREIKEKYPYVLIGAVTDGKANPLFMMFTLSKYFDFCVNWEDDQGGRSKFFQQLDSVEGNAELGWIYQATVEKARELASTAAAMDEAAGKGKGDSKEIGKDAIWIHVGDDLAYDVGGSAQCGAKTILVELGEKYGQTARLRFEGGAAGAGADGGDEGLQAPSWSTLTRKELDKHRAMNEAALPYVDKKIAFLSRLTEAITEILEEANQE